jgi:hypothetical protein
MYSLVVRFAAVVAGQQAICCLVLLLDVRVRAHDPQVCVHRLLLQIDDIVPVR